MRPSRTQFARLIRETERHVPFYRSHWRATGFDPAQVRSQDDIVHLPLVRKADLLAAGLEARLDNRYRRETLTREKTSGSSGQPFEMLMDRRTVRRRRLRFWRALRAAGCKIGHPLLLVADRSSTPLIVRAMRWRYAGLDHGESALAAEYLRIRPAALYGPLSALLMLGEYLRKHHGDYPRPRQVITTAEELSPPQHEALARFFCPRIADFYGMTEFGLMAWRPDASTGYRLPARELVLEFLPCPDDAQLERLVVTDLHGGAMPLIRYETGDLVHRDRSVPDTPIVRFAGREIDCLLLPGGERISPYRVTLHLETIAGNEEYRVIQHPDFSVEVFVRAAPAMEIQVLSAARSVMQTICGHSLPLTIRPMSALTASPTGKLRPVRSLARENA